MSDYHQFCQIKDLHAREGLKAAQIAGVLELDPKTVASWLGHERFRPRKTTPRPSKLDPFTPHMRQMLEKYPYSAAQVWQRLQEQGFEGGYSLVKASVRPVRPRRHPALLTLAFAPGECAQIDWGSWGSVRGGQTTRCLSFFVLVLGYSRLMYVEFTVSQTMEHCLACQQHACEFIGGVPQTVMVDHLTSAGLNRALGHAPVFNPPYEAFSKHDGFRIVPCNVGKGNEKGRVENGVGYVKNHCLAGRTIADFSMLAPAVKPWLATVAHVRVHRETRTPPIELWQSETPHLGRLPVHPFDIATVSQVRASRPFRIPLDTNRYSVPAHLAGQSLTWQTSPDRLCLSHQSQLVARHNRSDDRQRDFADPDHPKPRLEQRKKARDHQVFRRFLALSPQAELSSR
jgi:transposase